MTLPPHPHPQKKVIRGSALMSMLGLGLPAEGVVTPASAVPRASSFATSSSAYCAPPRPVALCSEVSIYILAPSGPMLAVIALLCCVRLLACTVCCVLSHFMNCIVACSISSLTSPSPKADLITITTSSTSPPPLPLLAWLM